MTQHDEPRRTSTSRWLLLGGLVAVALAVVAILTKLNAVDLPAAAQHAESYLRERGEKLDPSMWLILDYIDRRFGLPWVRSEVDRVRAQRAACTATPGSEACARYATLGSFARLIDPSALLTGDEIAALSNSTDAITASALYCKSTPLPATFVQNLKEHLTKVDSHAPPHAAMALQWAIEQGCLDPQQPEVAALRENIVRALVAKAEEVPSDAAIEAIAFLDYIGEKQRVRSAWLETIGRAQLDETPTEKPVHPLAKDHTTTLALWVLLEATRQPTPVPWVPPAAGGAAAPPASAP